MALSMTGFASCRVGGYVVEIQSVNKKGVEISVSLPRELFVQEVAIRRKMLGLVQRGHVFVKVFSDPGKSREWNYKKAHAELKALAASLDSAYTVSFETVLQYGAQMIHEEVDIVGALDSLWEDVVAMQAAEGQALVEDLRARCKVILSEVDRLEKENQKGMAGHVEPEKIDITEEIVRIRSHTQKVGDLLSSVGGGASYGICDTGDDARGKHNGIQSVGAACH